jgi:hypothetical protein
VCKANIQLAQCGSAFPICDADGSVVSDGTNSYLWNSRNQLASMNGGTNVFAYGGFGRGVTKSIRGNTKAYLYDGANIVQEF